MPIGDRFQNEIKSLINRHSIDAELDIPDFILAEFVTDCLHAVGKVAKKLKVWQS